MREKPTTILLTGATGFVGRYLMKDLLLRGKHLMVFARGRGPISAEERIEAILQDWEHRLGRRLLRPVVVEANIHESDLNVSLSEYQRSVLGSASTIIHSAASLRFEEDVDGEEPLRTNVTGTRNLIRFAQEWEIPHLHYVSTAYVCGQRQGTILETELDCEQAFHNIYEQSKFQAEQLIAAAVGFQTKTVFRPSIIVGDSLTGFSSTFHTIYSILRFLRALPDTHSSNLDWIFRRLQLTGNEGKNLIPVDWVSQVITEILDRPSAWNQTFHLTNPRSTTVQQLSDAIAEAIQRESEAWGAMALPASIVDAQLAYQHHVEVYRGYLADDPSFHRGNIDHLASLPALPELDHERLVHILAFAIRHRFRDSTPALPRKFLSDDIRSPLEAASQNAFSTPTSDSDRRQPWTLEMVGMGGGMWTIDAHGGSSQIAEALPWARLSTDRWQGLIAGTLSIEQLIQSRRLVIGGPEGTSRWIRERLESLLDRCREYPLHAVEDESDGPKVVPLHRIPGGRRHA